MHYIGSETIGAGNQTHFYQGASGAIYATDCIGQHCGAMQRVTLSAADLAAIKASTPAWWREKLAQQEAANG